MLPLTIILWAASQIRMREWSFQATIRTMVATTAFFILINFVYGFTDPFPILRDCPFRSASLRALGSVDESLSTRPHTNSLPSVVADYVPIPLPKSMLEGIDIQKCDFERGFRSYLMGEWKHGGWWYYYLVGFLVKEPIGFQLMLYVSILHGLWNWKRWTKESFREWSLIALPPLLIFGLVSSQTGFNHHMRYVLPAYPFLFIIAARTVTLGKFWKWFSYGCLTWQAASVLWFAPHWMSYFNEFAGGPRHGHDWLVDSNIDWGQDILGLKWWQDEHPDVDLQAALFTGFDPKGKDLDDYLPKCFLFLDGKLTTMDKVQPWQKTARYTPGQVWCPREVPRTDVNPRPLSPLIPSRPPLEDISANTCSNVIPVRFMITGIAYASKSPTRLLFGRPP